ncbi:formamidopyrimidine-DNA glycosylase [Nematocida homosporus]|uniref:formamidopyrimidine-DNA glycosylase n=1 Tax=Nematocida homosporus TaxID=1912981 RepID=UPI00221E815A|nr:formamidopyrimidine-DNA glycosylase [Nematocida homosporus]KAI5187509.1 formamidopyrimidine-DNA glycosylase [Nematocida homosporus]
MPEGPEVDSIVRILNSQVSGATISNLEVFSHKIGLKDRTADLIGRKIQQVERKGKWLVFGLDSVVLLVHLRMTGKFLFEPHEKQKPLVVFHFQDESKLFYCDPRGFGRMLVQPMNGFRELSPYNDIGPDPLKDEVTVEYLLGRTQRSSMPIKTFLLDQKIVCAIGNIYASEILFDCQVHPQTKANQLAYIDVQKLVDSTRAILKKAAAAGGTSLVDFVLPNRADGEYQNYLKVYARKNKPCFRCNTPIEVLKFGGRSSFFCPVCQVRVQYDKTTKSDLAQ